MMTTAPDFLEYVAFNSDGSYNIVKGAPAWVAFAIDKYLDDIEDSLDSSHTT